MMRVGWQTLAAAILGLMILVGQAHALPAPVLCCLCSCADRPLLCVPNSQGDCSASCPGGNLNDSCLVEGFNSSCPQVAECDGAIIPSAGAPAVSQTGLTAMAVLLGAFGIYQAARRSRRGAEK